MHLRIQRCVVLVAFSLVSQAIVTGAGPSYYIRCYNRLSFTNIMSGYSPYTCQDSLTPCTAPNFVQVPPNFLFTDSKCTNPAPPAQVFHRCEVSVKSDLAPFGAVTCRPDPAKCNQYETQIQQPATLFYSLAACLSEGGKTYCQCKSPKGIPEFVLYKGASPCCPSCPSCQIPNAATFFNSIAASG